MYEALSLLTSTDGIFRTEKCDGILHVTGRILVALHRMDHTIAIDEVSFGAWLDDLYFMLYEGAGSDNLRYLIENGGYFEPDECNFLWRLKHFRNLWIRHDIEHGKKSDVLRKQRLLREVLRHYGFNSKPTSRHDFMKLQRVMADDFKDFATKLSRKLKVHKKG